MIKKFDSAAIEKKWQQIWQESGIYEAGNRDPKQPKEYVLVEWPYPSGNLHIGHWHAFSVPDIYVRFRRMNGVQTIFPMGFDAFGLPAENAAIKRNINPREWTESNIEHMKEQLGSMGNAFSWDKTASSTDPEYYKWTQWMFTKFFENDIAYRGKGIVNWCPHDHTVIANEQVLADGTCERCGNLIEKREMPQWMMRITKYADRLVDDLDPLNWPEAIKDSQCNWIGRSKGAKIDFVVRGKNTNNEPQSVRSFIMGVDDITDDLIDIGVSIHNQTPKGSYEVTMSPNVVPAYEALITKAMKPGFWNEYVGDSTVFLFKNESGEMSRYVWTKQNEQMLLQLCEQYTKSKFVSIKQMLKDNDWYAELPLEPTETITVFTTRPDTLFGVTYLVLAPEHLFIAQNASNITNYDEVAAYAKAASQKDEQDRLNDTKEKTGVKLEGVTAKNPANGEEIPVFVADYVLGGYGTGAIMAVPAHDVRDREFAELKGVAIKEVIDPDLTLPDLRKYFAGGIENAHADGESLKEATERNHEATIKAIAEKQFAWTGPGKLINSDEFDGMDSEEAKEAIVKKVGGEMTNTYRLRDWSVGRQRYWGVPIPIVYDPAGQPHPVPEEHLPWLLPEDVDFKPTGEPPLAKSAELKARTEKIFGAGWTPEVETLDTFVDSSWYFLRYLDNANDAAPVSKQVQTDWMPIDIYFGGAEHTTMHLLYSRFWQKALFDLGLVTHEEPYTRRINRGLILGPDGNKMSKSKGNVIDPDEQVARVGADTVKMYLAFMGPYAETTNYPWDMGGIAGLRRFLERVNGLSEHIAQEEPEAVTKQLHKTIQKVRNDIPEFKFNTAISACMVFVNLAEKEGLTSTTYEAFLRLLAPFAPHLTEELWTAAGHTTSIHLEAYPEADPALAADDQVTIGVQVNGKVRGDITIAPDADEAAALAAAKAAAGVAKWLTGEPKKVIYKPGKILNLIV